MLLEINLILSLLLTGLIWTIQVVHYPSFQYVNPLEFKSFTLFHQRRITYIVAPLMIAELIFSFAFLMENQSIGMFLFLLVIIIWISTFILSVPLHSRLSQFGFDSQSIFKLVSTNWLRTFVWSLRSWILIYLFLGANNG